MKTTITLLSLFILTSVSVATEKSVYKLRMSHTDTFVVAETEEWDVDVKKMLTFRFADVNITPKKNYSFGMKLYFKCDTPDLSQFDSSEKIKKSVELSSKKYLPYIVEERLKLKKLAVKGRYGWSTVLTDAKLVNKSKVPAGEFKYMTRGMVRLSPDSALGFSLMTNEINSPQYKKLFDYIYSFIKEKN